MRVSSQVLNNGQWTRKGLFRVAVPVFLITLTLRHCCATHALEDGVDPVFIQQMLGHKRLQTTLTYLHMTSKSLMGIKSPLDTRHGDKP